MIVYIAKDDQVVKRLGCDASLSFILTSNVFFSTVVTATTTPVGEALIHH